MSETKQLAGAPADVEGNGPPPSYDSVFGKWKDAKKKSSGPVDFMKSFFTILFSTIGFLIFVAIMLALPVAMIVIGAINLDNCPIERFVPIWLVTSGAVFAFMQLVYIGKTIKEKKTNKGTEDEETNKPYSCFNSLLSCFNFAWFIAGNVWVFRIYAPNTSNPGVGGFCNYSVYYFSFWLIITAYISMILACCCGISLIACCVSAVGNSKLSEKEGEAAPTTSN